MINLKTKRILNLKIFKYFRHWFERLNIFKLFFNEKKGYRCLGIDPSAKKYLKYYNKDVNLVVDIFLLNLFEKLNNLNFKNKKFKLISSFAMFYDIDDPNILQGYFISFRE